MALMTKCQSLLLWKSVSIIVSVASYESHSYAHSNVCVLSCCIVAVKDCLFRLVLFLATRGSFKILEGVPDDLA